MKREQALTVQRLWEDEEGGMMWAVVAGLERTRTEGLKQILPVV
jgi:hypothetical protein